MEDEKNIHWTKDEAVLERYVMGRVGPDESAALDQHLDGCAECREAVRAERQIVAGIRRVGRDQLKHRLAQRVGKSSSGTMTVWYRIAGIAAAIVLLVTIGIYNDWFSVGKVRQSISSLQTDSSVTGSEQRPPGVAGGKQSPGQMPYADGRKEKQGAPQGVTEESLKDAEKEQRKALQRERGNPQNIDVAHAARGENAPANDEKLGAFAAQVPQEIWVGGTVISAEREDQSIGKSMMKSDEKKSDNLRREKSPAKPAVHEEREAGNVIALQSLSVIQKKLFELPQQQRDGRVGLVQMHLRKETKGLQVTLFMDSLLSKNDLGRARLQTIPPDSGILHLGQKQIAFKLPQGWLRELPHEKQ